MGPIPLNQTQKGNPMQIPAAIRHNQITFIAIGISILLSGIFTGCQVLDSFFEPTTTDTNTPGPSPAEIAAQIAAAAAPHAPPPYKEILLVISGLLTSGIFVDNRRKDTVIKVLKSTNANSHNASDAVTPNDLPNPTRKRPGRPS